MAISVKIDGFDADSKIVHIGKLFRYENKQRWFINLWVDTYREKKFVPFSLIPLLARGRILNQTNRADSQLVTGAVNFTNHVSLEEIKLSDCPVLKLESDSIRKFEGYEWGFKFKQQNGLTVYLPQLEFARVLFLNGAYLSRAAMSTTDLINDFDVHIDSRADKAVINVMDTTSFPMRAFNYTAVRNMIAWILLDANARNSFTSIDQNLNVESVFDGPSQTWLFRFTPPDLKGWELGYKGKLDRASYSLLVYEITAVDIVPVIPSMVEFRHPSFKYYMMEESLDSEEKLGSYKQRPDDILIDDEGTSSSGSEPEIISNTTHRISFKKPFQTKKQTEKKEITWKAVGEGEGSGMVVGTVSTAEPEDGGELQAADFASGENETDYTRFCEDRFKGFFRMLEVLQEKHGCEILNKNTNELPNTGRSKKHLLETGAPRMICCVTVVCKGTHFKILEIDTSDGIKLISTRVVMVADDEHWNDNYRILKQRIIASYLTWPIYYLNEVFGEDCHVGIMHPSNKVSGKGNIPWDSIPGWARRVSERLV